MITERSGRHAYHDDVTKRIRARFTEPAGGWHWQDDAFCNGHRNADYWTSENSGERRTAARWCVAHCKVIDQCFDSTMLIPLHSRWNVAAGISWDGHKGTMLGWPSPAGGEGE